MDVELARGRRAAPGVLPGVSERSARRGERREGTVAAAARPEIAEVYEALVTGTRDYLREERVPLPR